MPLFRLQGELHYFAHVPKAGGSSVEEVLMRRFGPVAFRDSAYLAVPEAERWSVTSPQHVEWAALVRIVPEAWIASAFTVVRHPVARAVSAWRFLRKTAPEAAGDEGFDAWLAAWAERPRPERDRAFDGHMRPQSDFAPPWAEVFHLEHGLDRVIGHLDRIEGRASGPRAVPHANPSGGAGGDRAEPSAASLAIIEEHFAEDFQRYGYVVGEASPREAPRTARPAPPGALARLREKVGRRVWRALS